MTQVLEGGFDERTVAGLDDPADSARRDVAFDAASGATHEHPRPASVDRMSTENEEAPSLLRRRIPWSLVALRVLLAPVGILVVWAGLPRWVWLLQLAIAIISDLYDGKLARRWGVVTPGLRQADSIADTIYALGALASFWLAEPEIISDHVWGIGVVVALEAVRYPLDWFRFGRGASYHSQSARLFGLLLIPVGVLIMGFGIGWPLWIALSVGLYSELEGMAISLVLPRWTHDVTHVGVALAIRREADAGGQGK